MCFNFWFALYSKSIIIRLPVINTNIINFVAKISNIYNFNGWRPEQRERTK
jgi:hypothetical protein